MKLNVLMPNFAKRGGLVTVVAQDIVTNEILMVASTDRAGFLETLKTGKAVYYSTSRKERWKKGEESGNTQSVRQVRIDCDGDALIYLIVQKGQGACHEGRRTCFSRSVIGSTLDTTKDLNEVECCEVCKQIAQFLT